MSDQQQPGSGSESRFTPQNKTTHERLSTNTVGLVALSDFRKRRAEVLEQQEREARESALARTNASTPDRSLTATPNNAASSDHSEGERAKRKKKRITKALVSFGDDEDGGDGESEQFTGKKKGKVKGARRDETGGGGDIEEVAAAEGNGSADDKEKGNDNDNGKDSEKDQKRPAKVAVNSSVGVVPRALTKAALRREAAEREALRKEFLLLQAAVKATEIAIPFVFYDGTNTPGGVVRVKKGDFVWLFLDKSRKVGAQLGVGADKSSNARRDWARVGVDDLMLVRGSIIIPHHYEFYFFIINKTAGPGGKLLFDYSAEVVPRADLSGSAGISGAAPPPQVHLSELEGASDNPTFTKVVDRRWYQRNKHIYPASVWQEFDPEKDYQREIPRDPGGNAFFFSK